MCMMSPLADLPPTGEKSLRAKGCYFSRCHVPSKQYFLSEFPKSRAFRSFIDGL